jgi:hypothetical protein
MRGIDDELSISRLTLPGNQIPCNHPPYRAAMLLQARGSLLRTRLSMIPIAFLRLSAVLILGSRMLSPSWAQSGDAPGYRYPTGSQITFQWDYSCSDVRRCSFACPERGGANQVTKLTIYLGSISLGGKDMPAIFYDFATTDIPRGSGFSVSAGLTSLSCQINGLVLDYSGPAKTPSSNNNLTTAK